MSGRYFVSFFNWKTFALLANLVSCQVPKILCNASYQPESCDLPDLPLHSLNSVEDFERCAPALLPKENRNYFWGDQITYYNNKNAYSKIHIERRVLRDVSQFDCSTTVLGHKISFPVGVSPTAGHKLAHPTAEIGTANGVAAMQTVMVLSSFATTSLEAVAAAFKGRGQLWMQIYPYKNRMQVMDLVRRAEKAGFHAIVVTVDPPIHAQNRCSTRPALLESQLPNFFYGKPPEITMASSFKDLSWICSITHLPVVAKGILSGEDAIQAIKAGVKAILVSNHGGPQFDSLPPTIEVLPSVVAAVNRDHEHIEVYVDGGVRTGRDVFKALKRGARAVFVARPVVWGLSVEGAKGVEKILTIIREEFNETMILAGYSTPEQIRQQLPSERDTTVPPDINIGTAYCHSQGADKPPDVHAHKNGPKGPIVPKDNCCP